MCVYCRITTCTTCTRHRQREWIPTLKENSALIGKTQGVPLWVYALHLDNTCEIYCKVDDKWIYCVPLTAPPALHPLVYHPLGFTLTFQCPEVNGERSTLSGLGTVWKNHFWKINPFHSLSAFQMQNYSQKAPNTRAGLCTREFSWLKQTHFFSFILNCSLFRLCRAKMEIKQGTSTWVDFTTTLS